MISWRSGPTALFRKQTTHKTRALNGLRTLEYPLNDFFRRCMES